METGYGSLKSNGSFIAHIPCFCRHNETKRHLGYGKLGRACIRLLQRVAPPVLQVLTEAAFQQKLE